MKYTNEQKIGLSMAVMLADDSYDYDSRPNAFSTTGMLKSTRQIILTTRASKKVVSMDISALVASSFGNAVHDAVEKAWLHKRYIKAMLKLGYSKQMIDRIIVNPSPKDLELAPDCIPVYIEKRSEKEVGSFIISGKFDFVGDGQLEDHKTTGVYTYIKKTNDEKFRLQGSIYRWLNPDIITNDVMLINYTFTDFSALRLKIEKNKGYPPYRIMSAPITLMSIEETQKWIESKIRVLKQNIKIPEEQLPMCTKEELWQDPTVYKYYKNPLLKNKSTKNFDNFAEAQTRLIKDGSVGIIDIIPGIAKFCHYCAGAPICSQAKQLVVDGLLDMEV
jgi:hypothetical protein